MCQSQYGLSARYSEAIFTSHVTIGEPNQLNFSHLNPRLTVGFEFICGYNNCIFDCNYGNSGRVIQIGDQNKISDWRL